MHKRIVNALLIILSFNVHVAWAAQKKKPQIPDGYYTGNVAGFSWNSSNNNLALCVDGKHGQHWFFVDETAFYNIVKDQKKTISLILENTSSYAITAPEENAM